MPQIPIHDIDDPRIEVYRDLLSAKASRRTGLFVAEGRLLVDRLVASSFVTHSILVDERRLCLLQDQPDDRLVFVAPAKMIEAIIGFNFHRGMLACGYRQKQASLDDVIQRIPTVATVVVCVGIHDPTNLGSILRSAAAFGVDAVLLGGQCSDPFSRRVLRVSMGATLKLPLVESDNLVADLHRLRDELQFESVATVLEDAEVLETTRRAQRMAMLIGNEAHGLPQEIVEACERRVTIPMQLGTDSLNAAVASGIMLHHFTRVAPRTSS
ncbi:MAG: RNA methyltransferase [Planctomycetaceae bacterium]|nr:RNA methyltransferase [Planctomycetales bacterium]MCB9924000.1 RNA methyltransferase [Planctomycetaceae bacterium]